MVDKALRAANEVRSEKLDGIASRLLGFKVATEWNMFVGSLGAYVTTRVDRGPMTPKQLAVVEALWLGWGAMEEVLTTQQRKARR